MFRSNAENYYYILYVFLLKNIYKVNKLNIIEKYLLFILLFIIDFTLKLLRIFIMN